MRTQHKINKSKISIGFKATPNHNGYIYNFYDTSFVFVSAHNLNLANKIELAAMTLYMSMLGLKCSGCSYEKYLVTQIFNSGSTKVYTARCLKCGQKRSVDVIFNKEEVPK